MPGFSKDHQAFVFVRFAGRDEGQAWLAAVQPDLASAGDVQNFRAIFKSVRSRSPHPTEPDHGALRRVTSTWVNLALSFAGLRVLLPSAGNTARFPSVFRTNRVPGADPTALASQASRARPADPTAPASRASRPLGIYSRPPDEDVHGLLIVAADQKNDLERELHHQRESMRCSGVSEVMTLCGDTLPGDQRGHEHFGFKDVISQPRIESLDLGIGPPVGPGEFVLGYPDQTGQLSGAGLPAWTRNGSFLAFLQLQQHVATFWSAMKQHAQQLGVQPDELASWIVGRRPDGCEVSKPPARLSHVGRAYSRWLPPSDALRHRILRRGIPYGPPLRPFDPDDHADRGLLFLAYQADLERQFEHVWSQWLNSPAFPIPGAGRDALVGQATLPTAGATTHSPPWTPMQQRPAAVSRAGQRGGIITLSLPAFVSPRFGGYFFAPAIDALSRSATW